MAAAVLFTLAAGLLLAIYFIPVLIRYTGSKVGELVRNKTGSRRELLIRRAVKEEAELAEKDGSDKERTAVKSHTEDGIKVDHDWSGIVGFFHPFWYVML